MNSLELFKAIVEHIPHDEYLFFFHCTPDLERRLRQHLGLKPQDSFVENFDMPRVAYVALKPPEDFKKPDFSKYYEDMDIPPMRLSTILVYWRYREVCIISLDMSVL
ncbi:hypothetical protein [Caldicoprobacter faecalis]|uniref:Uncharacterized protein n=1 Tax=Caldicoprobacter faecalis TaxID=937334 RepID=A0A1I5UHM4_9FIRM|nr:hypothetical protein [Caldicoprobacter faecalis]SFP94106.1 hypothetical protein SAMN05444406_10712 [Caldicoprobacter faecalis]